MSGACEAGYVLWKGRRAVRLANGTLEVIALRVGGHLACIRRLDEGSPNILWESPWPTIEPDEFSDARHASTYGGGFVGRFLSGYTGHAAMLGYFGAPDEEQIARGLPLHGEIASAAWQVAEIGFHGQLARAVMRCDAPDAGLHFTRTLELHRDEAFVRIGETVENLRETQADFQWVQHATFGEPLLTGAQIWLPAARAITWPLGYEGKGILEDDREFAWPHAPRIGGGTADLSRAFTQDGTGYVVAVQLDPASDVGFVAATSPKLRLAAGYCFPRGVFPWVAVWEESRARESAPWNGVTRARGLEFGNTPLPLGLAQAIERGSQFGTPTFATLAPRARASVEYHAFAAEMPGAWNGIARASAGQQGIELLDRDGRELLLPAHVPAGDPGTLHRVQETG